MNDDETPDREIKSVRNSFEIIDHLKKLNGATVSELTKITGLTKGTVHTHLSTLVNLNYVKQTDGKYYLTYQFIIDGEHVRNHTAVFQEGWKEVNKLAITTGEYVHLMAEHEGGEITLHDAQGENAIASDYRVQMRQEVEYLHSTASGKAILAYLPEERVEEIIKQRGMPQLTQNTLTDREQLIADFENIRSNGYAINEEEEISGIMAVGVPILKKDNTVMAALSISAPTNRMTEEKLHNRYPDQLKAAKKKIESELGD